MTSVTKCCYTHHVGFARIYIMLLGVFKHALQQQTVDSNPITPSNQAYVVHRQLTLCSLQGIGSWQRQLIAVTCTAEHA